MFYLLTYLLSGVPVTLLRYVMSRDASRQ